MSTLIEFIFYAVRMGTPLLYATTGEIISERVGNLNLGVEGMMAVGAICGFSLGCVCDSLFVALIVSFIAAALCGLIYAVITVTFQANQTVTGLALTIFGNGLYLFIGRQLRNADKFPVFDNCTRLKWLTADNGIPVLRDIPVIGKLLFSYNILVYVGIVIAIVCGFYIFKTKAGLKMRAVGENPGAADAAGVNVNLVKYINIILGGGICGLGGLYMAFVTNSGSWNEAWINGTGWIAVALVIFANWNPVRAIFGSFLFGIFNLLLIWKGNLADAFPAVFGWLTVIPNEFYQMLPFLITAIVLVVESMRKNKTSSAPANLGNNYYREER